MAVVGQFERDGGRGDQTRLFAMRGMSGLALQLLRAASGVLATGALAKGVAFSTDGRGHESVTYLAWYGAGAVFVIATVVLSIVIYKRHDAARSSSTATSDPCRELLILLRGHANQLAWNLEHFWNCWDAVRDQNFKGKLSDGYGPTTHADSVETLLFMFGQFSRPPGPIRAFACSTRTGPQSKHWWTRSIGR
jgi:hypothetical protein